MVKSTGCLVWAALIISPIWAAEQSHSLAPFDQLTVKDGFEVAVVCGKANQVTFSGDETILPAVKFQQTGNEVLISHDAKQNHTSIRATVMTSAPLVELSIANGVALSLPACALSTQRFALNLSNGAMANIGGEVNYLKLTGKRGVSFNQYVPTNLRVGTAEIDLSQGAKAYLCGATQVKGRLAWGAVVYVGNETNTTSLTSGLGTTQRICSS